MQVLDNCCVVRFGVKKFGLILYTVIEDLHLHEHIFWVKLFRN